MKDQLAELVRDFDAQELPEGLIFSTVLRWMGENGIEPIANDLPAGLLAEFVRWAREDFADDTPPERFVWFKTNEPPWFRSFLPEFRKWLREQNG